MTQQPPAVRFQAEFSNQCWHFDLSPSDLKHLKQPAWVEPGRGNPLLMLYSVVDDRSGVCYQEYHCVYREDVEAALRFLFNAMSAKVTDTFPFQGIPEMIYTDNGPIAKSHVFQNVMGCLGIKLATHLPKGKDGRRVTARSKGEKRERELRDLIRKGKKPVALFVDEAHDLHNSTLTSLKRLIEVIEDGGGTLSVVLAGHPKLKNDLRRPTMEEIGYRATVFSLEGIVGSQREYIEWLISECTTEETQIQDVLDSEAIDLLASRLRTPLQIEQHLVLAFEAAYQVGEKPVTVAIVESVLSKQVDDLEPTLTRHGYDRRGLAEQFNAKPAEVKSLCSANTYANTSPVVWSTACHNQR